MKKYTFLLAFLLLFITTTGSFAGELENLDSDSPVTLMANTGPVLAIDTVHVYEGMEKSYAEGYLPTISGDKAIVVLPLLPATSVDKLTVAVDLGDPAGSPFVYKNYEKSFTCQTYDFNGETAACFLIRFDLPLKADRSNGVYPVIFRVSGQTAEQQFVQDFPLFVSIDDGVDPYAPQPEPPSEPSLTPKLMVESYQLEKEHLAAGERAKLKVTVRNTSNSQAVRNIKFSFMENSGEILPVGTGSQYCREIASGRTYPWNLEIEATATAQSRPHTATVMMEYEDSNGNAISTADRLILPVRQPVRLEYEEPSFPSRVTQGDTPTLSIMLMNLGKSTVYNALLKFELPGLSSGGSVLVGTIEPGNSVEGRANFRVAKDALGEVRGTLFLSYEDEYGESYEEEIPLVTTIEEKKEILPPEKKEETAAIPRRKAVYIVAGVIVLLAAAFFAVSRWLKEKRAREEDELRL